MKIAIVGSGISGLVVAHRLAPEHDVTIFEASDYAGGRHIGLTASATSLGKLELSN